MKFRPCINVFRGKVVHTIETSLRGGKEKAFIKHFESEYTAADYARLFKHDKLKNTHILSLGSGNDEVILKALGMLNDGMKYGGGVTAENAAVYLDAGASHIIVSSHVFNGRGINFANLKSLVKKVGKDKVVLDISYRKKGKDYHMVTHTWGEPVSVKIDQASLLNLATYCDEIIVHRFRSEKYGNKLEFDLIKILGEDLPVKMIYADEISSISDLNIIKDLGNGRIDFCIGTDMSIYGGPISYQELTEWNQNNEELNINSIEA